MNGVKETQVKTPLGNARVWTKGRGRTLCFLGGAGGLKKWTPFLDTLAQTRKVVAPSLPGFPGGASAASLDQLMEYILASCDVLEAAECLDADIVGASFGATMAAEIAAFWPDNVKKLVLIAPFGIYDEASPVADIFAQKPGGMAGVLSEKPDALNAWLAAPDGVDPSEWEIETLYANMATANLLWPLGDTRIRQRLWRITAPSLVLWGEKDRVMAPSYGKLFQSSIGKNAKSKIVKKAGHMSEFDEPAAVAKAVTTFLAG
ncbi:MAG: alpha/beta hydrolase [Hyphomicrobiales bacterium]|nr:alpha/beta hydrolase [Hyphomicrobiales bacterium]